MPKPIGWELFIRMYGCNSSHTSFFKTSRKKPFHLEMAFLYRVILTNLSAVFFIPDH